MVEQAASLPALLVLPAEASSPRTARRWVAEQVVATGHEDLVDVVELLVTEVVTNAVLHAGTTMRVSVRSGPADGVRVDVWDGSSVTPRRQRGFSPTASTGRGIQLLDSLASSWGSAPSPGGGKVTWFYVQPHVAPQPDPVRAAAVPPTDESPLERIDD